MRMKYNCLEGKIPKVKKRRIQSEVWRPISIVWADFIKSVRIKLESGMQTSAWLKRWTALDELLIAYVDRNKHLVNENAMVR